MRLVCRAIRNSMSVLPGYLPKNKAILRHVNLLLFAQQIAAGMVYLEQQRSSETP